MTISIRQFKSTVKSKAKYQGFYGCLLSQLEQKNLWCFLNHEIQKNRISSQKRLNQFLTDNEYFRSRLNIMLLNERPKFIIQ